MKNNQEVQNPKIILSKLTSIEESKIPLYMRNSHEDLHSEKTMNTRNKNMSYNSGYFSNATDEYSSASHCPKVKANKLSKNIKSSYNITDMPSKVNLP